MATPSSSSGSLNSPPVQSSTPTSSELPSPMSIVGTTSAGVSTASLVLPRHSTLPFSSTASHVTCTPSTSVQSPSLSLLSRDFNNQILSQNTVGAGTFQQINPQHSATVTTLSEIESSLLRNPGNFIINETIGPNKSSSGATTTTIIIRSNNPNAAACMMPFLNASEQQHLQNLHAGSQSHHIVQQQGTNQGMQNKPQRVSIIVDSGSPLSLAALSHLQSEQEQRMHQVIPDTSLISTTTTNKHGNPMLVDSLQPTSSSSMMTATSPSFLSPTTTQQDICCSPSKILEDCCPTITTTTSTPHSSMSMHYNEMKHKQQPTTTTILFHPNQMHPTTTASTESHEHFIQQDQLMNLAPTTQSISSSTQTDIDISEMIIGKVTSLIQQQQQQQQQQHPTSIIITRNKNNTAIVKSLDNPSGDMFYNQSEAVVHKESEIFVPRVESGGNIISCGSDVSISAIKSVAMPKSTENTISSVDTNKNVKTCFPPLRLPSSTPPASSSTAQSPIVKTTTPTLQGVDIIATTSSANPASITPITPSSSTTGSSSSSPSPRSHRPNLSASSSANIQNVGECSTSRGADPVPSTSSAMIATSRAAADTPSSHNNSESVSSESIDIEIKDISLDEADGYQDNTSSNSQQSGGGAGGVNLSGGNNGAVGNGNGSGGNYISLLPPPVGTTGLSSPYVGGGSVGGMGGNGTGTSGGSGINVEQTDFKYLFEELCPVCGDKVSGYHYGLLTCESCKGFFKRTVQNKKVYTCVAERQCHIDKTQRKRCPFCRFQKCLEVGMKLEAVRADRMRGGRNKFGPMYKRDRARKLQMMRQRQLALQAIRGSINTVDIKPGQLSPTGYQQSYPSMSIKQEIQIPQVSSLTQSPDSSPSPIAIALGQVNPNAAHTATSLGAGSGLGSTNTTTVSGASGDSGGGGCGPGSDGGSGASLQHSTDSKLCFDTGTNPSSTADSVSTIEPLRVSPMIREFVQSVDDREWQTQLFTLLQKQSYNQVEVDLFELMCKVLDQNLFSQVDWARNTIFFKDLKVDDQMKLLQNSWSDMLVLDHLHQRIHNNLPDETPLHNGQIFNLLGLGLLGVPQLADYFNELQNKLLELKFDMGDYVCMKFLLLLNPDVRGIINRKTVLEGYENVQAALLDYTLTCYPSVTDKFSRLLGILPDIHAMAARGEDHLYLKHCAGNAPTQTLLMEMLHAKRKL